MRLDDLSLSLSLNVGVLNKLIVIKPGFIIIAWSKNFEKIYYDVYNIYIGLPVARPPS